MEHFIGIPFKAENEGGFWYANGIAKFSDAGIVLEFERKYFGFISTGIKEIRLSVGEILDVKFKKGVLKHWATIELRSTILAKLTVLSNRDAKVTLRVNPNDFERARDAVAKLQQTMTGETGLPPIYVPVASLFEGSEEM